MLAPLIAALLVAPAEPPRPGPTDESTIYAAPEREDELSAPVEAAPVEAAPVEAAPVEAAPVEAAPVEITPPPPRPEPAPVPEPAPEPAPESAPEPASKPSPVALELPPPPPPPSGAGRLVGGSLAVGLGLGASAAVIVETAREGGDPRFVASTFIPLGLASLGVGTYLLVRGAKARANFNDWRAYTKSEARPSGAGLLVGGTMGVVIGGVTLVAAGVQARDPQAFEGVLAPTLLGVGGAGVALGVGALTWGLLRRNRYRSWRESTFLGAAPILVPTLALTRGGLGLGLAGRL